MFKMLRVKNISSKKKGKKDSFYRSTKKNETKESRRIGSGRRQFASREAIT